MDYKTSGVDVQAGRNFVAQITSSVESTHQPQVLGGLGGFGGCIRIPEGYKSPVLVAGTDGVGTKLELAQQHQRHFEVGIDLVAMCVNDVITNGAKPLFFLDYIATGTLSPQSLVKVIEGIANGCKDSGCSLLGGETAEMPGFYEKDKYDLAGFCVGVVEAEKLIDGHLIRAGDQILAIQSSGIHSNGFSLVRKILSQQKDIDQIFLDKDKVSLVDKLLSPTLIYVKLIQSLLKAQIPIHGMAHITGGGLPENLPRCLPSGLRAAIDTKSWEIPSIFRWLEKAGQIPVSDLWNTFNLGVGFCVVLPSETVNPSIDICSRFGLSAWNMGRVEESSRDHQKLIGLPF
ncbi:phosphoribosylformylglycinamidine cyclo-ligase [Prochlorococcus sp. MIT 1223]|uniref:phosphoribosylformylglycinamidine cyclo-ligase n=1 Tax=Prochlorococcus sp. MIT 1223 TaxID=3096217 RepID=UPI002A7612ED|nr:phosphoribosylformylglycinamidine cyclo-ligase [Prochlorococcus sp. MIT 1223]